MFLALGHTAERVGEIALADFVSVGGFCRTLVFPPDRRITKNFKLKNITTDARIAIISEKLFQQKKSRESNFMFKCPQMKNPPQSRVPADELNYLRAPPLPKNVKFTGPWAKSVCFSEGEKGK